MSAVLRGVDVSVILPGENNHRLVDWAMRHQMPMLADRGVKIYRQPPPFAHTKLLLIDGEYTLLGSANLDPRSLNLNFELVMEVLDLRLAEQLSAFYDEVRSRSVSVPTTYPGRFPTACGTPRAGSFRRTCSPFQLKIHLKPSVCTSVSRTVTACPRRKRPPRTHADEFLTVRIVLEPVVAERREPHHALDGHLVELHEKPNSVTPETTPVNVSPVRSRSRRHPRRRAISRSASVAARSRALHWSAAISSLCPARIGPGVAPSVKDSARCTSRSA